MGGAGRSAVLAWALFASVLGPSAAVGQTAIAIVGANVVHPELDGDGVVARDNTVVIVGTRITAVGPSGTTSIPAGATVIDAKGQWVVPGLIDSHVHFFQSGNLYTRPDAADFGRFRSYAEETRRNKARLPETFKVWLASGVTGVADVGGPFWNFEVRDLARNTAAAPRVATTGPLISMIADPKLDLGDPPIVKVTSAGEARALVQRQLPYKPDFIKVWFIHEPGDDLAAQEAIVKATAQATHAAGVRLAVHATELVVAKSALRAGADYLVHSVFDEPVDQEFITLALKNHVLYCPTLFVPTGYALALSGAWEPTEAERRLADPQILAVMHDLNQIPKELIPERVAKLMSDRKAPPPPAIAMQNLVRVWNAGIPVVMGTDAGNIGTLHGPSVFREMELMVQSGLTPLQVLRSATVNAAATLGLQDQIGRIAAGRLADLVVLDADPLQSVDNLSKTNRVFKGGQAFKVAELMSSLP